MTVSYLATGILVVAILHTFLASYFHVLAARYPSGSMRENVFHLLGEIEVVFGFWASVFIALCWILIGGEDTNRLVDSFDFTEPLFIFTVMATASTRPVVGWARRVLETVARVIPLKGEAGYFIVLLTIGPLLGSLITEPAAMTIVASLIRDRYFSRDISDRFRYFTLAVLFVNISIGGVLTHFAAPPVVMVAAHWEWGTPFMFAHFGWKAMVAIAINAGILTWLLRQELASGFSDATGSIQTQALPQATPFGLVLIHLAFLAAIVASSHHPKIFIGIFLFFLGVAVVSKEYQDELKLKESLLVGFFLAGLVVLGSFQGWWLQPLFARLNDVTVYLGAVGLTAVTDNAALTYLGSQVPDLPMLSRYALVAGAVVGGGLTVIANAPNPAGYSLLQDTFRDGAISPFRLFVSALYPTAVAGMCFWFL